MTLIFAKISKCCETKISHKFYQRKTYLKQFSPSNFRTKMLVKVRNFAAYFRENFPEISNKKKLDQPSSSIWPEKTRQQEGGLDLPVGPNFILVLWNLRFLPDRWHPTRRRRPTYRLIVRGQVYVGRLSI